MKLNINIKTSNLCKVTIQDTSNYYTGDKSVIGEFSYNDTASIDIIKLNKLQETVVKDYVISLHKNQNDSIQIPIKFDGWFTIQHIVIPNKDWFDRELSNQSNSQLDLYSIVYYTDGNTIYKYVKEENKTEVVPLNELIYVNNTSVSSVTQEYISICFLRKCYINLCNQIFESRGFSSCWNKNSIDSELVFKRDLVWMAINVIEYLTKLHSECNPTLHEVERIIENLNGCNRLCSSSNSNIKYNGCGCSK